MTHDEWKSGENKLPVLVEFNPNDVEQNNSATKRQAIFKKKLAGETIEPTEFKMEEVKSSEPLKMVARPEDLEKMEELTQTICTQKETINEQNIRIEELEAIIRTYQVEIPAQVEVAQPDDLVVAQPDDVVAPGELQQKEVQE